MQKEVNVQIAVKRLDEKAPWYFARCVNCNVEIDWIDGVQIWKMQTCYPTPGQKVNLFCPEPKSKLWGLNQQIIL